MEKIKKIAKYTTNILAIIGALITGINAIDGITIPYAYQITQVIVVVTGVIGTYLLGNKAMKGKE
jgi:lysozyme family protein